MPKRDYSYLETFALYQECAKETAIYDESLDVLYPALGLAGEAGEVANKVKKIYRDCGGAVNGKQMVAIAKELGDVLWYVAALCTDLGINMGTVARQNLEMLRDRADRDKLQGSGDDR
jgi:NTP pyrophosphatase (non-canonical NTP hydrolase)